MYIFKQTVFNNTTVDTHKVIRVEIQGDAVTLLLCSVDSSLGTADADAVIQPVTMPLEMFSATPYPECVSQFLTATGSILEGGISQLEDVLTLPVKQQRMLNQVEQTRDQHIHGGLTFQGLGIDTDEVSLRNIMGSSQMATLAKMAGQPFTITWRCADNSMANFDADNFILLAETVMQHVQACYTRSWDLKDEINSAPDLATLDGVAINDGWPV